LVDLIAKAKPNEALQTERCNMRVQVDSVQETCGNRRFRSSSLRLQLS
jgi:hypothetical protein